MLMIPVVLHPYSRGSITLSSADPLDRPIIDPQMLSDDEDKKVLKAGKYAQNTVNIYSLTVGKLYRVIIISSIYSIYNILNSCDYNI